MAHTGQLPAPVPSDSWWSLEDAQQPPLYYLLASLFVHRVEPSTLDSLEINPSVSLTPDETIGNKNVLIHPINGQAFAQLQVPFYLLRALSILFSMGSVLVAGLIIRLFTSARYQPAVILMVALNPLFVFTSISASSLALFILLVIGTLYIGFIIILQHLYDWRWFVALGGLAGMAALTSLAGLFVWLTLPLVAFLLPRRSPGKRLDERLMLLGASLGVALAIAGWWYVRNLVNYGYLINLPLVHDAASASKVAAASRQLTNLHFFWGIFGWGNIAAGKLYYSVAGILGVLGILGLLLELARVSWEQRGVQASTWRVLGLAGGWLLVSMVGAFTPFIQPPIVFMLSAAPIISAAIFLGLRAWLPIHLKTLVSWVMPGLLIIMSLVVPWRFIKPNYTPSAFLTMAQVPASIHDVNIKFGKDLFLVGYELLQDHVTAGKTATIRLYWLALAKMETNYRMQLQVNDPDQNQLGIIRSFPDVGRLATSTMLPGDVAQDEYSILLNKDTQVPTSAEVRLGVSAASDGSLLQVTGADGKTLEESPVITHLAVTAAKNQAATPQVILNTNLGDKVLLIGYDLSTTELAPGGKWQVTLYWKPLVPMSLNYTVFVHLLDENGESVAQMDEQPVNNRYPTSLWQLQDTVTDVHTIILPARLPSASYSLSIGMYLLDTGERLPIVPSAPTETDIILGPYTPVAR
ncbi:MAG: ArnT family glycosyltransferase [Anaerolineae bacterium]